MKGLCGLAVLMLWSASVSAQPSTDGNVSASETSPQMQQMHARMQAMRLQMDRIQATENPEERERLLDEHMQDMHAGMSMMGEMMRGGMNRDGGTSRQEQARQCADGDTECRMDQMQARQKMMGERMNMMQMMMEQMTKQMMQREAESATAPGQSDTGAPQNGSAAPGPPEGHEQHH